jgi:hypothetical protein
VRQVIGPAATVIGTEHYQAKLVLTCGGGNNYCSGDFPKFGNKAAEHHAHVVPY